MVTGRNDQVDQWENKLHDFSMLIGGAIVWNTDDNFSIYNPFDPREHWEFW